MQWDATANAGFSKGKPWLPIADDFVRQNVLDLKDDATSILNVYLALIRLRRASSELTSGTYEPVAAEDNLLIYRRRSASLAVVVVLNLAGDPVSIAADAVGQDGEILLSTFMDRAGATWSGSLGLRGNEGVLLRPKTASHSPSMSPRVSKP
jgi:alpha-glucosidase